MSTAYVVPALVHSGLPRLQAGGNLREDALYVERQADDELYAALRDSELCYVLAPRQMGKSSLCAHAVRRLSEDGCCCVHLDMNRIGGPQSTPQPERWFHSLFRELGRQLGLGRSVTDAFWEQHQYDTLAYRWALFLRQEILVRIAAPIVLIFDEIDTVLTLPFAVDDFFAVIRDAYNARDEDPAYRRLAFCFVGVATPGDLISDAARTPFNVGHGVFLDDFSAAEAEAFLVALRPCFPMEPCAKKVLDYVLSWTAGHPYLTHKLCAEIVRRFLERGLLHSTMAPIDEIVHEIFLARGRTEELGLQYAEKRLSSDENRGRFTSLLRLYRSVLVGAAVPANLTDPLQAELRLCGLVRRDNKVLVARCRIFSSIYDLAWIQGKDTARFLDEAIARWMRFGKRPEDLIRGQALSEARAWISGRDAHEVLPSEHEFLLASMEDARRVEQDVRNADAQRAMRNFFIVLCSLLAVVAAMAVYAAHSTNEAKLQKDRAAAEEKRRADEEKARQLSDQLLRVKDELLLQEKAARVLAEKGRKTESALRDATQRELLAMQFARQKAEDQRREAEQRMVLEARLRQTELARLAAANDARVAEQQAREADRIAALAREQEVKDRTLLALRAAEQRVLIHTNSIRSDTLAAAVHVVAETLWLNCDDARASLKHANAVLREDRRQAAGDVMAVTLPRIATDIYSATPIRTASYSSDGSQLALGDAQGGIEIWRLEPIRLLREWHISSENSSITSVRFDRNGRRLLASSTDGRTSLWDPQTGLRELQLGDNQGPWQSRLDAELSSDGKLAASAGIGDTVQLWSLEQEQPNYARPSRILAIAPESLHDRLGMQRGVVFSISFSSRGKLLAGAHGDGTVRIWDVNSAALIHTLRGHSGSVYTVAFSPDGMVVASAGSDATIRLWEAQTGRPMWRVPARGGAVTSLAFSRDGRWLAAGDHGGVVELFYAGTAVSTFRTKLHASKVFALEFSPRNPAALMSAAEDRVRIIPTSLSDYLRATCALLRREPPLDAPSRSWVQENCANIPAADCSPPA